jgi:hypothetical protein
MLHRHLPISDNTRKRLINALSLLYAALFIPMICMNLAFYRLGSLTPDPASGRTFAVQEHGTLYVLPWEGELALSLFWGAGFVFVLLIVVNPYRGRIFPLRDE